MHCAKNVKKFMGFKFFGPHEYRMFQVKSFFPHDRRFFEVTYKCSMCKCIENKTLVVWDELLDEGLTNEQIQVAVCGTWEDGLILTENESRSKIYS